MSLPRTVFVLITVLSLGLSGCAHQQRHARERYDDRGYGYDRPAGDGYAEARYGRVARIDALEGRGEGGGGGALAGGVIGGVIGNQVGKGGGRAAATVLGAVGGAIIGNEIERQHQGERTIYRVTVRLDRRGEQQFDLERLAGLRVGDRVRIDNGRLERF